MSRLEQITTSDAKKHVKSVADELKKQYISQTTWFPSHRQSQGRSWALVQVGSSSWGTTKNSTFRSFSEEDYGQLVNHQNWGHSIFRQSQLKTALTQPGWLREPVHPRLGLRRNSCAIRHIGTAAVGLPRLSALVQLQRLRWKELEAELAQVASVQRWFWITRLLGAT